MLVKEAVARLMEESVVEEAKPLPRTEAAYRAAACDTFVVKDLNADPDSEELRAILKQTEMIMVGGQRRLRLTDEARSRFLAEVRDMPEFRRVLDELITADKRAFEAITSDPVRLPSAWLRAFLDGVFGDFATAPPSELRAAVNALERLRHVPLGDAVPTLAEASRQLNLAELLEPLRILIGATDGWNGLPPKDRFSGREAEQRTLRSFVDVLQAQSFSEGFQRFTARVLDGVSNAFTERSAGVLVLAARGGLGKTALIAKFVLDHAFAQSRPFPFAYLDFDRGAIQPRDPHRLLIEVAGQVALQHPALEPRLSDLRRRLRAAVVDPRAETTQNPFDEFRAVVRGFIADKGLPFLLVLDTMEVVQYDPAALAGVVAFVDELTAGYFPELRVVAAGRADIPELRSATDTRSEGKLLPLPPLPVKDAWTMADRLGRDLLGVDWQETWAKRIAGDEWNPQDRREPLSIRVAVELLCTAEDTAARDKLAREIEQVGENARDDFVAVLYERRVLRHVRDLDVQALAWPGLVLRRVTPDIVHDLLAQQCGLTPERAAAAFDGLAREAWIVERKGDALHHHPDLRARTLPLMRRHDPALFERVNRAAIEYFGMRQERSLQDRAEWLYHRMLAGEELESLQRDWSDEVGLLLAGAGEDLPPDSPAAAFVTALTAQTLLPAARVSAFPPSLAMEHVARTASQLGHFHDLRLQDVILAMQPEAAFHSPLSPMARAATVTLSAKSGRWHSVRPFDERSATEGAGPWEMYLDFALRYCRARMLDPWIMSLPLGHPEFVTKSSTPRHEFRSMVQDLALTRLLKLPEFHELDGKLARMIMNWPSQSFSLGQTMIRLVLTFGEESFEPALDHFLRHIELHAFEKNRATISFAEMVALSEPYGNEAPLFSRVLETSPSIWRMTSGNDVPALRFRNPEVRSILHNALTRLRIDLGRYAKRPIRRFAVARDEDWLVPVAYAAARAVNGKIPPMVLDHVADQDVASRSSRFLRRQAPLKGDTLQILRRADEAGNFSETAKLFLGYGSGDDQDLRMLLRFHAEWRSRIAGLT
ncbi:hypothetical protein TSO352_19395 [Azospirillum sp. TSO35-2]|nr:hypothetical protein TSO352_19395 [Azospirillum sp. TSO35-2]